MSNDFFSSVKKVELKSEPIRDNSAQIAPASNNENKTRKRVEDISINEIDIYEENELLFGYNNLDEVEQSIKNTGADAVEIHVFEKPDGRYLVYSGNTRYQVLKKLGKKKVTCFIDGPLPDEDSLLLSVVAMNTQRTDDGFHVAYRIKRVEEILRNRGLKGEDLTLELENRLGYKRRQQFQYKKILTLPKGLQLLFANPNVPDRKLLEVCSNLPEDKIEEFIDRFKQLEDVSGEDIEQLFLSLTKKENNNDSMKSGSELVKLGKTYKDIFNLYRNEDGSYYIPESKKAAYKQKIEEMEEELAIIKAACE